MRNETRIFKSKLQVSENPKQEVFDLSERGSWGNSQDILNIIFYHLWDEILEKEAGWTRTDVVKQQAKFGVLCRSEAKLWATHESNHFICCLFFCLPNTCNSFVFPLSHVFISLLILITQLWNTSNWATFFFTFGNPVGFFLTFCWRLWFAVLG